MMAIGGKVIRFGTPIYASPGAFSWHTQTHESVSRAGCVKKGSLFGNEVIFSP